MSRTVWKWARIAGGVAIVAVLLWRLGSGPFLDGLRDVSAPALAAALAIGVVTTVCAARRWQLVARGLGAELELGPAVAAYYRAQFLNVAVPGGVVGDVHRAVQHGRSDGDLGRGVRAVVWERVAGQAVQLVVTAGVLCAVVSPVRGTAVVVVPVAAAAAVVLVVVGWSVRRIREDLRSGVLAAWPAVVGLSLIVVAGHTVTFLIAARAAGVPASPVMVLPLALLALVAMAVPLNVAGWGPREGVLAWAFGAAGLGAATGVTVATVYGVLVIASTLPGVIVLMARTGAARQKDLVHG